MITNKHRCFYVNEMLEFAFFYDPSIVDKDKIKENFLNSKDWKQFENQHQVRSLLDFEISEDLKKVNIRVKFARNSNNIN
jgi:hypothetical protein